MSKKTILLVVSTILLAAVAVGTAFWLYRLQTTPVAPNAPASKPKASTPVSCQTIAFSLAGAGSSPTPTPTHAVTPTPTRAPTAAPTTAPTTAPTATPTGGPTSTPGGSSPTPTTRAVGGVSTPTPTHSANGRAPTAGQAATSLPDAGVSWPIVLGVSSGAAILLIGLLLAL